jgi:hypothetical protein
VRRIAVGGIDPDREDDRGLWPQKRRKRISH